MCVTCRNRTHRTAGCLQIMHLSRKSICSRIDRVDFLGIGLTLFIQLRRDDAVTTIQKLTRCGAVRNTVPQFSVVTLFACIQHSIPTRRRNCRTRAGILKRTPCRSICLPHTIRRHTCLQSHRLNGPHCEQTKCNEKEICFFVCLHKFLFIIADGRFFA